jgi:hypothetical protein
MEAGEPGNGSVNDLVMSEQERRGVRAASQVVEIMSRLRGQN